jgi:hypothetical protein
LITDSDVSKASKELNIDINKQMTAKLKTLEHLDKVNREFLIKQ